MGDRRFDAAYERVASAKDRLAVLRDMTDAEAIHALAAASRKMDTYIANVLAVEVLNRRRKQRAMLWGILVGLATAVVLRSTLLFGTAQDPWILLLSLAAFAPAGLVGAAVYVVMIRRRID